MFLLRNRSQSGDRRSRDVKSGQNDLAMPPPGTVIVDHATKYFYTNNNRVTALDDINLTIPRGGFVSLIGASGCGKTTLLNLIAGLEQASQGAVYIDGQRLTRLATGVGYMTQHDALLPWRTVEANIALPLIIQHRRDQIKERVAAAIDLVGLQGFANHLPSEISGGMRKRVALAQSLIYAQELLLMDEPFGALDAQTRITLQGELMNIWSKERRTIVFVTHDIEEAIILSDQIVVMTPRPGAIREVLTVDLPRPRDIVSVRLDKRFEELYRHLWNVIALGDDTANSEDLRRN